VKRAFSISGLFLLAAVLWVGLSRPVYSGPRFIDNGDGTVIDQQLGLMWAKNDNQGDIEWKAAEAFAKFNFGYMVPRQYDNWRLPTLEELQSLYVQDPKYQGYMTDCGIRANIVPQVRLSCILVWSSESALGSHLAFNFNLGNSFIVPSYEVNGCRVLPVRTLE
jgi:hypothetical protein